ncbi:M24 family metallopeptidase [Corynebacterium gerontici]|uniref:Xaa-Pro dipeptidase n=1 Tax=Corynebacterium gerontici TaxID=2079234 RepID=A0A3G6J4X7_9CORY|nr:Xaa-Pro peptidase family protein [Corynebacterium gerontici]AZA11460.1 Xaa-Pro dipeptidase [Corynebacterium gerontici]
MFEGFSLKTFRARIDAAKQAAANSGLDGVLITPGPDFEYLLDSKMHTHERFAGLVLAEREFVFAPGVDVADLKKSVAGELGLEIIGWNDGEDPYSFVPAGKLAVSAAMTADHLLELQSRGVEAVNATKVLAEAFVQKDEAEIRELTRAGEAIDAVHRKVPELLRAGVTEREVADKLRELILQEHVVVDFIIVGSGPHGADPHHDFSDRVIEEGDIVVVDIGGTLDSGYHSDCTRNYVVGEPSDEQQEIYHVLQKAQEAGLAFVKPGVRAGEVDKVVRDIIEEAGYGEYFIHRTGHGIGLSCHEEPFIIAGNDVVLREGMAFSIEPGVYFPGEWGARVEDIVILEADGARPVNLTPHELQRV